MLSSLTILETRSPLNDIVVFSYCISSNIATDIFPFVFSSVCFQSFSFILFSQTSLDVVLSMQTWQKQEYFLLSNANTFLDDFVLIECNFLVPFIVSTSFPIDLSTSSIPICQKNLYMENSKKNVNMISKYNQR